VARVSIAQKRETREASEVDEELTETDIESFVDGLTDDQADALVDMLLEDDDDD
jgi:hypothetical protein